MAYDTINTFVSRTLFDCEIESEARALAVATRNDRLIALTI